MPSPPVYHPGDPDHERRVRWGLALVTLGMLIALVLAYVEQTRWPSAFCQVTDCAVSNGLPPGTASYSATPALVTQWAAYGLSMIVIVGVTVWWWSGRASPRAVVAAECCALFALSGWWFVVPAVPHGWLFLLAGGFVTALGTAGLFARDDHDATAVTTGLAVGGGILLWTALTLAALLGTAPFWAPLSYSPLFVGFLFLCLRPLSWIRTHVLFALSMLVLGLQPWEPLADLPGLSDVEPATPEPAAPLEGFAPLADVTMLVFVGFAILVVLTAVVLEFAFQLSPSMVHRVVDEVSG